MMMKVKYILLLSVLLATGQLNANAYDRSYVVQCLADQSYATLLQYVATIPDDECDLFLLNGAGNAAFQSNMYDSAAHFFTRSFIKDSSNVQANLYLGLIKKQQRKPLDALHYFQKLNQLKPNQPKYIKYISDCFLALKADDSSVYYLGKAYALNTADLGIAAQYAEQLYGKKLYAPCDEVAKAGLQRDSLNQSLLAVAARSFYFQKKYAEVLPIVSRLQKNAAVESVANTIMIGVYAALYLKDYMQAVAYSTYLMENGVESEQTFYYASKAYAGLKSFEKSNELLSKCLELAISENTETYYTEMAEHYEAMKMYPKAQKNYDSARYISGNNLLLYRKAIAYDASNDTNKAKKAYNEFLKGAKNEDTAIINFAKKRVLAL